MIKFKTSPGSVSDLSSAKKEYQKLLSAQADYIEKGGNCPMTGWLTLPQTFPETEITEIERLAKDIQAKYEYLVCIGIGGSYLGHRALIEAVYPKDSSPTQVLYAGNSLSPRALQQTLSQVEGKNFAINVISKSGTTTEPAIAFRIFREKLVSVLGDTEATRRIFATTDGQKGALHDEAVSKGYTRLIIPDDIGGRYSVLSAVGLLPLAVAGVDIRTLLRGAHAEAEALQSGQSVAALEYAEMRHQLAQSHPTEVLATMEPSMRYLAYWWEQLFGESEGKNYQGILPTSLVYTTDLHSMGQYLQQGRRDIFETFLRFEKDNSTPVIIPECADDTDGLKYLAGRDLSEVNAVAAEATIAAHSEGEYGLPVLQVVAPDFSAESLGALIYFFEVACAVSAKLSGVNPFDQPGVEAYKTEMFKRLEKPGYMED